MRFLDFGLKGRVAIVTGGSMGIGRGIALSMAHAGADIAILALPGKIEETAAEIRELGGRVLTFPQDVADLKASEAMVEHVTAELGVVDILVNDAGVGDAFGPAEEVTPERWDAVWNVNVRGLFFLSTAVARVMKGRGRGKIINIGSDAGIRGLPERVAYGTSKGAVIQLTRMLAIEWAQFGINVNCICPYYTRTERLAKRYSNAAFSDSVVKGIPMGRLGEVEDIGAAAVFLASEASDFITGQILAVDGGRAALL